MDVLEEELDEDDEPPKTPKRKLAKKTTSYSSDEDERKSTQPAREPKRSRGKKQPSPGAGSSDEWGDMDEIIEKNRREHEEQRKKQVGSDTYETTDFIDLSPKTPAFASRPDYRAFIGKYLIFIINLSKNHD